MSIEKGIRQDDTWVTLDPVVGCVKDCKYCFLQTYDQTPKKGVETMTPDESIDNLLEFENYLQGAPVMVGSETDAFMSPANIRYFSEFLRRYEERNIGNPLIFSTKCFIPDEFIKQVKELSNTKVVFYLSYSGLPKTIEPTTRDEHLESNFERLHKAGLSVIHYWRPFLPQNAHPEKIKEIIELVSKYATCSVAVGLKVNDPIIAMLKDAWPELADNSDDAKAAADVWPEGVKEFIEEYTSTYYPDYPLFWVNSCALTYALGKADFNGMFDGHVCGENHCPPEQRRRCRLVLENYTPDKKAIETALSEMDITCKYAVDEEHRHIVLDTDIDHGRLIYLRQKLNYPVVVEGQFTSENEWSGQATGKESVSLPYGNLGFDIDVIWERSQYTRELFRDVERKEWGPEQYALELVVQVGHLADIVLRQDHKLNKRTSQENYEVIADEVSDVILNIFSIADAYGVSFPDILRKDMSLPKKTIVKNTDILKQVEQRSSSLRDDIAKIMLKVAVSSNELTRRVASIEQGKDQKESLVEPLLESFYDAVRIIEHYEVNLMYAFNDMIKNSEVFVDKNRL